MEHIRTILLPTDLSEGAAGARAAAVLLARKFGAKVVALHVVDSRYYPAGFFPSYEYFLELLQEFRAKAKKDLADWCATPEWQGVEVESEVREGDPYAEVLRVAADRGVDVIVMGTHGRTGIEHALLGSTAEKVVRRAPCAVLTVRMPAPAKG